MESYKEQPYKKYISFKRLRLVAGNNRSFDHLISNHLRSKYEKKIFVHNVKIENLTFDELKTIAKMRRIKGYKSMSKERLISSINKSKPVKEKNFDGARTENIRKDFNELRDFLNQK